MTKFINLFVIRAHFFDFQMDPFFTVGVKTRLRLILGLCIALALPLIGCRSTSQEEKPVSTAAVKTETALFAGGCFWCLFAPFENEDGVLEVVAGYSGGDSVNPTYEQVSSGKSGHREVIQITYDPAKISFEKLLEIFWRQIDPSDEGGQFADRGPQYTTAIYFSSEEQKRAAEKSKKALVESGKFSRVVTEVLPARPFYLAEEYHQDYNTKNPLRYKAYQEGSGRAPFLRKTWKQD